MVISGPARPPVLLFQLKARKSCWKMVQMMTRRMNATIDQVRLLLSSFLTKLLPSAFAFSAISCLLSGVYVGVSDGFDDGRLRDGVVVFDFCDLVAVLENLDVVGQTHDLFKLGEMKTTPMP